MTVTWHGDPETQNAHCHKRQHQKPPSSSFLLSVVGDALVCTRSLRKISTNPATTIKRMNKGITVSAFEVGGASTPPAIGTNRKIPPETRQEPAHQPPQTLLRQTSMSLSSLLMGSASIDRNLRKNITNIVLLDRRARRPTSKTARLVTTKDGTKIPTSGGCRE